MVKVAVVQAGSVPFDAVASTEKTVRLIGEAADGGARTVLFPEAFLGTYPKGLTFGSPVGRRTEAGRAEYARYAAGAVTLDGPELAAVAEAAAEHDIFVVLGIIEKVGGTLYCTVVMIDPERGRVGHHRKLMPTGAERLVWGFGDGSTLPVVDSPAGRLGTVICWENYMPALRQAMYGQQLDIYCAPTADDRDTWASSMQHVALEGRCFVLSACQYITRDDYPEDYEAAFGAEPGSVLMRGGSMIVDPSGAVLAGPVYNEETILYADLDPEMRARWHLDFDAVGHYARPDIFELRVDRRPKQAVTFEDVTG
ncbi:carbon-nitrogen hydrolase family protein [Georgenia halophila]|uniref:Carbon-nitrogen hydrolase family protein n=1 Tax=Georgenia halophila TaxID=620889 RepID=A0ABP8KSE7_9MICO